MCDTKLYAQKDETPTGIYILYTYLLRYGYDSRHISTTFLIICKKKSNVTRHAVLNDHGFEFDRMEVIAHERNRKKRKGREAI